MITTRIGRGDIIDTQYGFVCIEGRNDGGLFVVVEYEFDDDEFGNNNGNQYVTQDKLLLTAADIERRLKELDGKNHRIVWTD